MFLQRKIRTTLDLLMPKPKQPIIRDEAMERTFNRRFGTKPRYFSVGDKVYARHRLSQQWKAGHVTTSKGAMYYVEFPNGSTSRFHATQLIKRDTDQMDTDPLDVFNEEFGLPNVAQQPNQRPIEAVIEPNIVVNAEPANDPPPAELQISPNRPRRQYPKRNRRPPDRYSPK
ncbi:hypothetical protein niasHT_028896 [Heterodera trifolii]|uniref:Uncharacterized protein n=1 Tax=Heterodera trifolii TaxID=157864 RepID=A0ABD2KF37_9BILA